MLWLFVGIILFLAGSAFYSRKLTPWIISVLSLLLFMIPGLFLGPILLLAGNLIGLFSLKKVEKILDEKKPSLMLKARKYLRGYKIKEEK